VLDIFADVHDALKRVNNKQVEELAGLAGFVKRSDNRRTIVFSRGPDTLRVHVNSAWVFYSGIAPGEPPDLRGIDHTTLVTFLNTQIVKQ
jgi:hypothetical protein